MKTWPKPHVPVLHVTTSLKLFDTSTQDLRVVADTQHPHLYTCGITPYDATHLGHAFTYVMADTLMRWWLATGKEPIYAQNITDIDDPLFERAEVTQVNWRELADSQIDLFRSDMELLGCVPPQTWTAISEVLPELEGAVRDLEKRGLAYRLENSDGSQDVYLDISHDEEFAVAPVFRGLDLRGLFEGHGGDSNRLGKKNELDPLIWKGVKNDCFQPRGEKPGYWRPGWHIECALIMAEQLKGNVTVQAGGRDLVFPHHEMSESHLRELFSGSGVDIHMHAGMVAYEGEKMSKSLGNLVRVSELVSQGEDPQAVRLVMLGQHYRTDWEYTADLLRHASERLSAWREAFSQANNCCGADACCSETEKGEDPAEVLCNILADDLNTPQACVFIDNWARSPHTYDAQKMARAVQAFLGVDITL